MRRIKINSWKSNVPKRDKEGKIVGAEEAEENLLMAINVLIANRKPEQMPRGIDKFRTMGRIAKAFDKAEKSKELVLEETDYKFLKDAIESDILASWGMNENLNKAFEDFLNAEEVSQDATHQGSNRD